MSSAAHFFFFFSQGGKNNDRVDDEEEKIHEKISCSPPPQYIIWTNENPFADSKSTRSLPRYEAGLYDFVDTEEKKEEPAVKVMERELRRDSIV